MSTFPEKTLYTVVALIYSIIAYILLQAAISESEGKCMITSHVGDLVIEIVRVGMVLRILIYILSIVGLCSKLICKFVCVCDQKLQESEQCLLWTLLALFLALYIWDRGCESMRDTVIVLIAGAYALLKTLCQPDVVISYFENDI